MILLVYGIQFPFAVQAPIRITFHFSGVWFPVQVPIRITFCCVCWGFLFLVPGMQSRPAVPVEVCDLRFLAGRYLRTFHPTKY